MEYMEFIKPELACLIPALYALGMIIKQTEKIKDNYIPLILTLFSLALSCLYVIGVEGVSANSVFTAIVQGLICAACAVYANQLIKQTGKGNGGGNV